MMGRSSLISPPQMYWEPKPALTHLRIKIRTLGPDWGDGGLAVGRPSQFRYP